MTRGLTAYSCGDSRGLRYPVPYSSSFEEPDADPGLELERSTVNSAPSMTVTLVLGGARSGKTAHAQQAAEAAALALDATPVMIATAQAFDDEMRDRIARHQADRGERWRTVDAPVALAETIDGLHAGDVAVADCLTLWLTNVMLGEYDVDAARDQLLAAVAGTPATLWLVSNEVGFGIVPESALARRFRDEAGRLHQAIAAQADEVVLVVAGLPLWLKSATVS